MPPRSKHSKIEWVTCQFCGCSFSSKDEQKHMTECGNGGVDGCAGEYVPASPATPVALSSKSTHGYIHGHSLHAVVTSFEAETGASPSCYEDAIVAVHPTAMKICRLQLAGPVIVDGNVVLSVWPNGALPLAGAVLSTACKSLFECGQLITIEALPLPHLTASHITFKSVSTQDFLATREFISYIQKKKNSQFVTEGNSVSVSYFGQSVELIVKNVTHVHVSSSLPTMSEIESDLEQCDIDEKSRPFSKISDSTKIVIETDSPNSQSTQPAISLSQIGGLDTQIEAIQELVHLQMGSAGLERLQLPRGVLVYGPSGCGKSVLIRALAHDSGYRVIDVTGAEIFSKYYGETEAKVAAIFRSAHEQAPCFVLLDEVDSLCGRRESSNSDLEKRVVAALLAHLDNLSASSSKVLVLATTNKPDDLDPALRRPSRLDREIEVGVPTALHRLDILTKALRGVKHAITDAELKLVADKAHGFVGADLSAVVKEAGMRAVKKCFSKCLDEHVATVDKSPIATVTFTDLMEGMRTVQPSAMREVALEVPDLTWADIGGQHALKYKLKQAIEWPLRHPESFERLGIRPPRGLLMFGPPGCSKTMIAKALARESGLNFIAIKGPELFSKYVGESERAVREVFRKARAAAPAIVFFDEIDALAGERGQGGGDVSDRVLAQLLTEIDGVDALRDVTVVAATNRPDRIDKALLRPGRLDRIVYVPLPDAATRRDILHIRFRRTPVDDDVDIEELVSCTEGYSGAEVSAVCVEAALAAMQESLDTARVARRHYVTAMACVTPRLSPELVRFYEEYQASAGVTAV